jgi:exodeoxyribonuclease V alpha subunit
MQPIASSPLEGLAGLIERITFFNEENGFCILKIKAKGHRDLVTVLGNLPTVTPGEWLSAHGRWVRDREHGLQFRAEILAASAPSTREGIEKYLGSGMVKGIGPVYAKKLVEKHGEQIFEIIDHHSARLEEIDGIGPKRRHQIKAAWAEQKVIREIMVFLHSHGVSTSRAVRIFKTYGEDAIQKVSANPYSLARDIPGIGFKTADQIARKVGIPFDSTLRARAGLRHILQEAMNDGHCALPVEVLKEQTWKLLEVASVPVDAALEEEILQHELVMAIINDQTLVYLPRLKRAEEGIASRLIELSRQPNNRPAIDFEKALAWCQQKTSKMLAPSQIEALRVALASRALVITGGPGVGKTTLLHTILMILRAKKQECLLCAPTGRAAKRLTETTGLPAKTIHRLLSVVPKLGTFAHNENNPLDCDLLVVDECSMVDVPLMHSLLRALPDRASLLLVGDVDQLPSVGPGMVLADVIRSGLIPVVRLTEVFRQAANSRIITSAHRINQGLLPELPPREALSDFYFIERETPEQAASTLVQVVKQRIPEKFGLDPMKDIQVLCPMNRGVVGIRDLNAVLQNALNPRREPDPFVERFGWQFRLRDKVIQTENNYDKDVFNGDIGHITHIDPVEQEVTITFDGRAVPYDYGELDEITPAYAITIHKSQGSEFPAVVIPLAMQQYLLSQRNLIYTGITRGKKLVVLVGQSKALAVAVNNHKTQQRFSGLFHLLQQANGIG